MYAPDGQVRRHWKYLARALAELGPLEFERRAEESRRLLLESGVTYHVYGDREGTERPWDLDPIPFLISSQEWAVIEAGLIQRAEVLNLLLKDLYGPRDLIKKDVLPPELIYAHGGFLRPCTDIQKRGEHWLTLYAADLARARRHDVGPRGSYPGTLRDRVRAGEPDGDLAPPTEPLP